MIPLAQLLSRFKGLTNTDKAKKEQVVEILSTYKIPTTTNQVAFVNKKIVFKLSPILKTELLLKKEEILENIQKRIGKDAVSDLL
jgi:hypothetical protein